MLEQHHFSVHRVRSYDFFRRGSPNGVNVIEVCQLTVRGASREDEGPNHQPEATMKAPLNEARSNEVLVIGAGVVGITTAHRLNELGYKVTVIEAGPAPAMETSYANAGELSFGYSGPWATPGLLGKLPAMLLDEDSPLVFKFDLSSFDELVWQSRWSRWMLMNSARARFERNKRRILALSARSKHAREALFPVDSATFDHQRLGTLQLCRDERQFEALQRNDLPSLRAAGVSCRVVDADGCVEQEPGLSAVRDRIAGGFVFTEDETGDCNAFTKALAGLLASLGVTFRYGERVLGFDVDDFGVAGVRTTKGMTKAQSVVLCAGPWTPRLARMLEMTVPIYPVRGYSATYPVKDDVPAVRSTILDEGSKVAITRLGRWIRVGGTAGIVPQGSPADPRRHNLLNRVVEGLFPGTIGRGESRMLWHGHRPMTPDGTPIVGRTYVKGVYINAGHGTLGWTQSFASAELLGQVLSGGIACLDPDEYSLLRYGTGLQSRRAFYLQPARPALT